MRRACKIQNIPDCRFEEKQMEGMAGAVFSAKGVVFIFSLGNASGSVKPTSASTESAIHVSHQFDTETPSAPTCFRKKNIASCWPRKHFALISESAMSEIELLG